jgi:multidrug efflux pump subunit AcrA (membrane-fusion protein)
MVGETRGSSDIPVRARVEGVLTGMHFREGSHVKAGDLLYEIDPEPFESQVIGAQGSVAEAVTHLAKAESDLGRIPAEASVTILPAVEGLAPIDTQLSGLLPVADAIARTIQIEARMPNPDGRLPTGLSAVARVLLRTKASEEVLIPEDCVARDGLEWVVFRRDAADKSTVVRLPVELGERSGDTIEVLSGLMQGEEIVLRGVHQLVYAGLGKIPSGVHIHADGTSHADHK